MAYIYSLKNGSQSQADQFKLVLHFSGVCDPNPGVGACSAIVYGLADDSTKLTTLWTESRRLGDHCTDHRAEYLGYILGLRLILRQIKNWINPQNVQLLVNSDAELFVKQMQGNLGASVHLDSFIKVARSLSVKFKSITFQYTERSQNQAATQLTENVLREIPTCGYSFFEHLTYYPNMLDVERCFVGSSRAECSVSHDYGTSGYHPQCLIDAHFLESVAPGELQNLVDPCPLSFVSAKASFRILGIMSNKLDINFKNTDFHLNNVVVVDYLPVPLHVSIHHPDISSFVGLSSFTWENDKIELIAENFPEYYRSHQYWKS